MDKYLKLPVFIRSLINAFTATALLAANLCLASPDPLSGGQLYTQVEKYASFGEHRTGTDSDLATADWLQDLLASSNFGSKLLPFELQQFFPAQQFIDVGDTRLEVFPHWLPNSTTGNNITAALAQLSQPMLENRIAYLAPQHAGEWYRVQPAALAQQAHDKGALALVIAVPHPSGEIYQTNAAAPFLDKALPIPTVIVAAKHQDLLQTALKNNTTVTLASNGETRQVTANNVIAQYPAQPDKDKPWVVISTPISGWFQCAGERGSGVALWVGLAQWVASQQYTGVNWLFVGNSGHELSMMGVEHSLPHMPEPNSVKLWLHLGASIGARQWREEDGTLVPLDLVHVYNKLYTEGSISGYVKSSFADVPDLEILPEAELVRSNSELGHILDDGYPAAGMVGSHRFFHTPLDTPVVTSADLLSPYGEALRRLAHALASDLSHETADDPR